MVGRRSNKSYCFVPGCQSGSPSQRKAYKLAGTKIPSLFAPPRDNQLFETWRRIIPRADKVLTRNDRICDLHFNEDDIERDFITYLNDGSVWKYQRGRPSLKQNAVPVIFPNLPFYLSKYAQKRQEPPTVQNTFVNKRKRKSFANSKEIINNEEIIGNEIERIVNNNTEEIIDNNVEEIIDDTEEIVNINIKELLESTQTETLVDCSLNDCLKFADLVSQLGSIKLPNQWWGTTSTSAFIVCTKWTPNYLPERWIIINKDLTIKVFFKEREMELVNATQISSIEDISCLILEIDQYSLCSGINDKSLNNCQGYLEKRKDLRGKPSKWCNECKYTRKLKTGVGRKKNKYKRRGI